MALIQPNSTIKLFKNIPFDPSYEDTMYFATESARDGWFGDRVFKTYSNISYQRHERNSIRLEETMDVAYNYNYMAFKNTSFENKWFYAFVTDVKYVNNITVEIVYEIDYIQSWLLNASFNECFIERQHEETDIYGDNLLPESPATGPFVYDELEEINYTPCVILVTTIDKDHMIVDIPTTAVPGYQYLARGGMISGCWYYKFETTAAGLTALNLVLKGIEAINKQDEVICLIMAASELWVDSGTYSPTYKYYTKPSTVGSYTPRNSKVLVYPYSALSVSTWDGNETLFQQELFVTLNTVGYAMFEGWQNINAMSSLMFIPHNYKNRVINYEETVESPTTPQCSWKNDQYMAWLSQNFMGSIVKPLGSIISANASAPSVNSGAGIMNKPDALMVVNPEALEPVNEANIPGASTTGAAIALIDACLVKPLTIPDKFRGQISNTSRYQFRGLGFNVLRRRITSQYAERIDKYFDMFGYRVNKVGVPNLHARPKYTYVKTINCSMHGYLPADAARAIEHIFNKGIRFWDTSATFGSFEHNVNDNRPVSNTVVTPSQNNTENGGEPNE